LSYAEDENAFVQFVVASKQIDTDGRLEDWIGILPDEPKTKDLKRLEIRRLTKRFPFLGDITKKGVSEYLTSMMLSGLSRATVNRSLSTCRRYWTWLQSIEVVNENLHPFTGVVVPAHSNSAQRDKRKRRPYTPIQVAKLLQKAKADEDQELADVIEVGRWTGARLEEIAALEIDHVHLKDNYLDIIDAKTEAGVRQIPIHKLVKPTLQRLIGNRSTGYLFAHLTTSKYGDRSGAVGKRFGRLKTAEGYGPEYVFHSIRKTVITILEQKGVAEGIVADIVGHEKQTITYGLYSGGTSLVQKAKALAKLEYPEASTKD
jgi:integrase